MKLDKKTSKKERTERVITKWAFGILFALCIQFLVYIVVLNFVPTMISKKVSSEEEMLNAYLNPSTIIDEEKGEVAVLNPLYKTDRYYTTNGYFKSSVDNPTSIIYYYNMCLLIASILLIIYYLVSFMDMNDGRIIEKVKKFLKQEWPFALLLVFMIWVFISSLLAEDAYRSFVGCYNLKDGYFSFMMYGSILVCSMLLLSKDNEKYKKILVNTFLITATILALITLWNYYFLISKNTVTAGDRDSLYYYATETAFEHEKLQNGDVDGAYLITYGTDASKTVMTIGELLFGNGNMPLGKNFLIVTKRILGETNSGIFHNSNHYGYYLSICVIVAATMAIKENKNFALKVLYFISYIIMLTMAILNNTLGAYIGIGVSIIFMVIYALIKKKDNYVIELVSVGLVVLVFIIMSIFTVDLTVSGTSRSRNIVYNNFYNLFRDLNILSNESINKAESDENESPNTVSASGTTNVGDIGSGRGAIWVAHTKLALQKPIFGYGLENLIYHYREGRAHNLIIQLSATTGFIGMLLYVVGIASIWIRKLKYIKEWDMYECIGMFVIVSYIISSLVGNSGFYTSGYFYIFVGFVILSSKTNIKEEKNLNRK